MNDCQEFCPGTCPLQQVLCVVRACTLFTFACSQIIQTNTSVFPQQVWKLFPSKPSSTLEFLKMKCGVTDSLLATEQIHPFCSTKQLGATVLPEIDMVTMKKKQKSSWSQFQPISFYLLKGYYSKLHPRFLFPPLWHNFPHTNTHEVTILTSHNTYISGRVERGISMSWTRVMGSVSPTSKIEEKKVGFLCPERGNVKGKGA